MPAASTVPFLRPLQNWWNRLFSHKGDVKASDSGVKMPLDTAAQNEHAKVVKLLLEQGPGVKASDSRDATRCGGAERTC